MGPMLGPELRAVSLGISIEGSRGVGAVAPTPNEALLWCRTIPAKAALRILCWRSGFCHRRCLRSSR